MTLRVFSLATISAHLVLGNLCTMPMAMGEEMPDMPGMNHDMSAMASHEDQSDKSQGMPCDGEHCFTHALPTQTSLAANGVLVMALPTTPNIIEFSLESEAPTPISTAPPGQFIHVKTIVMRN